MESKWWEYYAVRYFVGTVVGAVLVAFLNSDPSSPFKGQISALGDAKEATFLGLGLLGALGFAFCYIASAPVLTLHAARSHLSFGALKASLRRTVALLTSSVVAVVIALWWVLPPYAAVFAGLVIGIQSGLVLLAVMNRFAVIELFYRSLAINRAGSFPEKDNPPTPGLEYVTSYRHLREHGNAFAILILEGVLAYALIHSPSQACAVLVVAFWILPASAAWLIGTALESRLVANPCLRRDKLS